MANPASVSPIIVKKASGKVPSGNGVNGFAPACAVIEINPS